jgi:uncharacterized protein YcaQ
MPRSDLSIWEARRIALAAQGFARPKPRRVRRADISRAIRRIGLLQLDFVNVLVPSHYQVLYSRLGPYDRALLGEAVYGRREFLEHWAHEASIVPVELWPVLRHRRETHRVWPYGFEKFLAQHRDYAAWVLEEVRARGPLTPDSLPHPDGVDRKLDQSWFGTVPRATLEAHFGFGTVAIAGRLANFTRVYDAAERVVPAEHYARTTPREEAERELLKIAARAHGIGTAADLADYFRMPVRDARPRLAELAAAGELRAVRVAGWREPAYLHPAAPVPRAIAARALLSPFDPVVWYRPRAARLFSFDHRFEIFTPQHKRRWGVYVLPFLLGEALAARVDLKADRAGKRLLVLAVHLEPGAGVDPVAEALAIELRAEAGWLGLDAISVTRRGELARALAAALRRI